MRLLIRLTPLLIVGGLLTGCSATESAACPLTDNEMSAVVGQPVAGRSVNDIAGRESYPGVEQVRCDYNLKPGALTTVSLQSIDATEGEPYRESYFATLDSPPSPSVQFRPEWGELAWTQPSSATAIAMFEAEGRYWRADIKAASSDSEGIAAATSVLEGLVEQLRAG